MSAFLDKRKPVFSGFWARIERHPARPGVPADGSVRDSAQVAAQTADSHPVKPRQPAVDATRTEADPRGSAVLPAAMDGLATVAREAAFAQCVQALRRTLATTPAGWLVVAWYCWRSVPHAEIGLWLAAFSVTWLLSLWILRGVARDGAAMARHAHLVLGVAALDGMGWGATACLLMGHDPSLDPWLAAVLCGVAAINAPVYITYIRAYQLQIGALWAMVLLASTLHPRRPRVLEALLGLSVFFALLGYYMQSIARRVGEGIRAQLINASLAEQLRMALQLVERDAATDALTGLGNRRALDGVLQAQVARAGPGGQPFSVMLLDIDHFKQVNDLHGHMVGDDALRAFACRLPEHLRQDDVCARYGGEEFVVVLPATALDVALEVAERVRRSIAETPLLTAPPLRVTVSIGVAGHTPGQTVDELLRQADMAVYAAKRGGRNQIRVVQPEQVA